MLRTDEKDAGPDTSAMIPIISSDDLKVRCRRVPPRPDLGDAISSSEHEVKLGKRLASRPGPRSGPVIVKISRKGNAAFGYLSSNEKMKISDSPFKKVQLISSSRLVNYM